MESKLILPTISGYGAWPAVDDIDSATPPQETDLTIYIRF